MVESRGAKEVNPPQAMEDEVGKYFSSSYVGMGKDRVVSFVHTVRWLESVMKNDMMIEGEEAIEGIIEEQGEGRSLNEVVSLIEKGESYIEIGREIHEVLSHIVHNKVYVNIKYKTIDKKVRPAAVPLPLEAGDVLRRAQEEPRLRDLKGIGHRFTEETMKQLKIGGDGLLTEDECEAFKRMLEKHGKAFAFNIGEMGCVDP
jgi:hypothetical protein